MKSKRILYVFFVATVVLCSCSEDDPGFQFKAGDIVISLKGDNIYLTSEYPNNGKPYREYFITDGIYTNGSNGYGWSMDDYDGATYFIAIVLVSASDEAISTGEYPEYSDWSLSPAGSKISQIYSERNANDETYYECYSDDSDEDHAPVIVTGGVNDGDEITLKFNGKLALYYHNGSTWLEETQTAKITFTGTVVDERP